MAYLEGRLSPADQREIEALLAEEGMDSDALEGLKEIPIEETQQLADRINYRLQHELRKKRRSHKTHFTDNKWSWLAIFIILILCVLAYLVLKMM
ncbi:MAG: hypothetical protein KDC07_06795 [Chitinophagaceae bacterium]|nr:hypothetical protein [Chitinophagaceae bacterium]MCB9045681.1 hypothetical protein [Chitinophagales bacterium]